MQTKVVLDNKISYRNGILVSAENKKDWLEVAVTPEALNAPESLWFCFRLKFNNRPETQNKLRSEWSEKFEQSLPSRFAAGEFGQVANYASPRDEPCLSYYKFMCKFYKSPSLSFEFSYSRSREKILEINDYLAIGAAMADAVPKTLKPEKIKSNQQL